MLTHIKTISKFTIIEAMRNRLVLLTLLVMGISFGMIEFIGDLSITERRVTQVAILAAFLRLSAMVIITMFVVTSTVRELHDKTLEMILAMSVRRSSYYFGKLIGFSYVVVLVSILFMFMLLVYAPAEQVLIWGLSLMLEMMLVVAFALVMLFSFNQIPSALTGVFVLYAASRTATSIYLMSKYPIIPHDTLAQEFMDGFIEVLTWLLPDLHRYTQTEWLAYGTAQWSDLPPLAVQTFIYLLLLSSLSLFDFHRKNF